MSKNLRDRILLLLEEHARTGSPYFKGDTEIADCLGVPVREIQRQLDILESQMLISSANSFEGHSARISPQGSLAVEELQELEGEPVPIELSLANLCQMLIRKSLEERPIPRVEFSCSQDCLSVHYGWGHFYL